MSQPFIIKFFKKLTSSRSDLDKVRRWFKKVLRIKKKKKKKFKLILKKPILVGFVLFLIIAGVFYFLFSPSQAIAEWWNTNWHYRQAITVTNSGSAQTDFQVKVLANYDMSAEMSAGKVQADFDDLRFTNVNGQSLDYWIEDDTATSLDVWARIPSIPAGNFIVYMYYGNPSALDRTTTIGTSSFPGLSCKAILNAGDSSGDGIYWIDPSNGDFSNKEQVYCDMTNNDGGWILIGPSMVNDVYTSSGFNITTNEVDDNGGIRYTFTSVDKSCGTGGVRPQANITISNDYQWDRVRSKKILGPNGSAACWGTDGYSGYTGSTNLQSHNSELDVVQNCVLSCSTSPFVMPPMGRCDNNAENFARYNQSSDRYFEQISRRVNRITVSGPGVGLDCQTIGLDWTIEQIYVREDNLLFPDFSISAPTTEERGPGPVGYWSFDEGYGTTAQDRTSNNNDGTIYSQTASWQTEDMCISGKCVYFNGVDSTWNTLRVGDDPSLGNMSSLTVSAWIKITEQKAHQLIYKRQGGGSPEWYAYMLYVDSSNNASFKVSNSSNGVTAYAATALELGRWYFIAGAYNGSNVQIYIDGVASDSTPPSLSGNVLDSDGTFQIGGLDGSSVTHGFIDEVKIYPYARTPAQIKADYNARGGATSKGTAASMGGRTSQGDSLSDGLVGYWKMDESSWSGVADEVIDASGNGNHGVAVNGATTTSTAKYAMAGDFDGTDDYVNLTNSNFNNTFTDSDNFTLSAWVKLDSLPSQYTTIVGQRFGSQMVFGVNPSGKLYLNMDDTRTGSPKSNTSLATNIWYHVVTTYTGSDSSHMSTFYIDGQFDNRGESYDGNGSGSTAEMYIGWQSRPDIGADSYFPGQIDEVRIYNRALSSREVRQLYEYAPGPVGHWKMDEKTGTNIYDSSGLGNTGILGSDGAGNDVPSWAQGKYGSGLEFYDDHVKFNDSDNLDTRDLFTFEGWYNFSDLNFRSDIYFYNRKNQSGTTGFHIIYFGSNQIRYQYANGTSVVTKNSNTLSWNTNQWYHIAVIHDNVNKEIKFYRDGILVGTSTYTDNALNVVSGNAYLGGYQGDSRFRGKIDDVRVYNYARTQNQILEDMNAGRPAQKSPIAHWKFDEGYSTTAYDSGLSGNDGTITGASWTNEGKLGKALDFNGTSDYVSCGSVGQSESFSLGTWLFPTSIPSYDSDGYFYAKSGDSYLRFSLSQNNLSSNVRWRLPGGSYTSYYLSENNSINEWVYINVVYDGLNNVLKGYKNGELQNIYNDVDIYGDFGQNLEIGRNPVNSAYYTGLIDDVKIYNYALTEDEIRQEYNQGKAGVMGAPSSDATGGGHSSALEYCVPGDDSYCAPPVGEWKFDEKTGDTIYDTSDNNNTGTINGMLLGEETWTIGKIGSALEFDGSDDYVAFSSPTVGANDLTVSFWMKPSSLSQETVLGTVSTYTRMVQIEDNNTVEFNLGVGHNYFDIDTNFLVDQWQHVTITKVSSGAVKIYLDGKDVTLGSPIISEANDINWNRMGREKETNLVFSGALDHIKIYDYARTPAQIAWEYNKGKPIAHWRFDEGQGATLYDSSGNENHGTLNLGSSDQTEPGSVKTSANTPWYNGRQGKLNYSLNFDGNDDYVRILDNPIDESIWSISMWFNIKESDQYDMLYSGNIDNTDIQLFFHATSKYLTTSVENVEKTTTFKINDHYNEWHHVIWTHSNSNETNVYIDGKNVLNTTDTTYIKSSEIVDIGSLNGNNYFIDGQIDEVKIYNYALTEDQIKTEYNMGAARFGTGN